MDDFNFISRRRFLSRSIKTGLGVALATLTDIPFVVKRALAEGNIGLNGKKMLFIWLRGANDGLNSLVPIQDSAYGPGIRPDIFIPKDPGANYSTTGPADYPINATSDAGTYSYPYGIRLGNGFAALHPALKFLAPVFQAGDLALVHRVGYPSQSRSHFDSQKYWENGTPRNNLVNNGILYRAMYEAILASPGDVAQRALTGVSIQSSLPLLLRGSEAAMTNLSDPLRYDLLGVPNDDAGKAKASALLNQANAFEFVDKKSRDLLRLQYQNLASTLEIFAGIDFTEGGNNFRDDEITDNDSAWAAANGGEGYYLFPTTADKNGGWRRPDGSAVAAKYAVPPGGQGFFQRLKSAALILNKTEAMVAGTEFGGFDTHNNQGGVTGAHADLNKNIGWSLYALRKYFTRYADQASWDDLVIVTLTEFGRTTVQNSNDGTDHAEAGVMWVAGGGVHGGVYNCGTGDPVPWVPGPADQGGGVDGSMFGVSNRYLQRASDYRSVLGEVIRKHLGATSGQIERIIPGYANAGENLLGGGSSLDGTPITGELGLL